MFKNGMRPIHPGEILLEDYIKPMGVSVRAVAIALHVPYSRLSEITKGNRPPTGMIDGVSSLPPISTMRSSTGLISPQPLGRMRIFYIAFIATAIAVGCLFVPKTSVSDRVAAETKRSASFDLAKITGFKCPHSTVRRDTLPTCPSTPQTLRQASSSHGPFVAIVEHISDGLPCSYTVATEIRALWEVLAQQAICVLVGSPLPRTCRLAEERPNACILAQTPVLSHSRSLFPGQ